MHRALASIGAYLPLSVSINAFRSVSAYAIDFDEFVQFVHICENNSEHVGAPKELDTPFYLKDSKRKLGQMTETRGFLRKRTRKHQTLH